MMKCGKPVVLTVVLVSAVLSLAVPAVHAIGNFKPTQEQLRSLPAYCGPRATKWGDDRNHPKVKKWWRIFSTDYRHMHHYCQGLLYMNEAMLEIDPVRRAKIYKLALGEFSYVRERVSGKFVLMPELYLKMAQIKRRLGERTQALSLLKQALKLKPDYVKAIKEMADLSMELGMKDVARKTLEEGLERKPGSKSLRRRLECLEQGGAADRCPPEYRAAGEGR